jgi:hypothetical protein
MIYIRGLVANHSPFFFLYQDIPILQQVVYVQRNHLVLLHTYLFLESF